MGALGRARQLHGLGVYITSVDVSSRGWMKNLAVPLATRESGVSCLFWSNERAHGVGAGSS